MDNFSDKNSGAKSNNLKYLRDKLDRHIKLPESASIPFQVAEYVIDLNADVKSKIDSLIEKVHTIKSVKKMNKMLFKCKELILSLKFHVADPHMKYLQEHLFNFGIP